jgi:hypothetical protein
MAYSLEYQQWTGEDVTASFEIEEDALHPGQTDDIACEGIGNIGRFKTNDGTLMLKMPSANDQGFEMVPYLQIRSRYTYLPYFPKSQSES